MLIVLSLKRGMTSHADGMVRFLDDRTALYSFLLSLLRAKGESRGADCCLDTVDIPFALTGGISAVGCYLNCLETEKVIFLPVFDIEQEGTGVAPVFSILAGLFSFSCRCFSKACGSFMKVSSVS